MILGIFGSRTLKDERVRLIILEKIKNLNVKKLLPHKNQPEFVKLPNG